MSAGPTAISIRRSAVLALVAAGLYLAVALAGITVYPLVFEDEVTLDEPARVLASEGRLASPYFELSSPEKHFGEHYFWQPPGQALLTAASYKLFGFGIWQSRLPGILCAAGCIVAMGMICGEFGIAAVMVGTALLVLNPQFFRSSTNARMDTLAWLLILSSLLLVLRGSASKEANGMKAWVVPGLLVGLAGMAHPIAVYVALAYNIAILARRRGVAPAVVFDLACAAPAVCWLAWAAPHLDLWANQFLKHGASRAAIGNVFHRVMDEVSRTWSSNEAAPLYLVALVVGAELAAVNCGASPFLRRAGLLAGVVAAFVVLLMGKLSGEYNAYYQILLIPVAAAGFAMALRRPGRARMGLIAFLAAAGIWSTARLAAPVVISRGSQAEARDYNRVEAQLRAVLSPGAEVWGSPEAWYAVIHNGGVLREASGTPTPGRFRWLVLSDNVAFPDPSRLGYHRVAEVGLPLPPVGNRRFSSNDYRMTVWEAPR